MELLGIALIAWIISSTNAYPNNEVHDDKGHSRKETGIS